MTATRAQTGYAPVDGLEMYYEISGTGRPLVLLHGGLSAIGLAGGVAGDIVGLPRSRLAVLLGTTHITIVDRADWLSSMVTEFLDAPMPEGK